MTVLLDAICWLRRAGGRPIRHLSRTSVDYASRVGACRTLTTRL